MRSGKREITPKIWLLGAGVIFGAYLFLPKKQGGIRTGPEADLDALASMLIAETGFARDKNEMAQIVFVAVNRAKKYKSTIANITTPPGRPVAWNAAAKYRDRFNNASENPRWVAARTFAQSVLNGAYANNGFSAFVHPENMPTAIPCVSTVKSPRVLTATIAGARCLPPWVVGGKVVGKAMFA
jgi:hypothetical protein